ncbi:MAG: NYN domain-containing protein [Candidatus Margulisiibacteriota bacterium]
MLVKFSEFQRVGVFVDVQNMWYSAKHLHNAKLNFAKLMEKAVRGRQLIRAICYVIENPDLDQKSFLEMLGKTGFEIKSKPLRQRADGSAKGDWDMGLAIDAVCLASKLDIVVLVTGDGDFADLVYFLKGRGVFVEAISFKKSTNDDLIRAVDLHQSIESDMLLRPRPKRRRRSPQPDGQTPPAQPTESAPTPHEV